jgi:hypothetical protein
MSQQTARRFMSAAEMVEGKSPTVSDLPPTVLYALASPSIPEPIREDFMREAEAAGGATPPRLRVAWRAVFPRRSRRETGKLAKQLAGIWLAFGQ